MRILGEGFVPVGGQVIAHPVQAVVRWAIGEHLTQDTAAERHEQIRQSGLEAGLGQASLRGRPPADPTIGSEW